MRRLLRTVRRMVMFVVVGGVLALGGLVLAAPGVPGSSPTSGNPFAALWARVDQLAAEVGLLTIKVGDLTTKVGELTAWSAKDTQRVDALTEQYNELALQLNTLNGKVTTLDGNVATLDGKVATLDGKFMTLDGKVTTLDGKLTSMSVTLAGFTSNFAALTASVSDVNKRMDEFDASAKGMIVVDSMGAKVGDFLGMTGMEPNVVPLVGIVAQSATGTHPFVLQLFPDRLVGNPLFFAQPNCIPGTAYVKHTSFAANSKSALALAAVTAPGMLVWVTEAQVPADKTPLVTPKSTLTGEGFCTNYAAPQVATRALPVVLQVELNPHFVPPFAVQ